MVSDELKIAVTFLRNVLSKISIMVERKTMVSCGCRWCDIPVQNRKIALVFILLRLCTNYEEANLRIKTPDTDITN